MRVIFFSLVFLILAQANNQIYFMPYEQKEAILALKNEFSRAQKSIKVSIYSFTNKEIAKVLRDKARQGIGIWLIYDEESNRHQHQSTIGYLAALRNIHVCTLRGKRSSRDYYGIMHQKMAIVDDSSLILGSANWSKNAFENNYEVLLISRDRGMIHKALSAYGRMLNECVKY